MNAIFLRVIELSVAAACIVVVILALRLLLRNKAPKWVMCALWGLVAVRLIFPFTIESVLSMQPDIDDITSSVTATAPPQNPVGNSSTVEGNTEHPGVQMPVNPGNSTVIQPGNSTVTQPGNNTVTQPGNNSVIQPGNSNVTVNPGADEIVGHSMDWLSILSMVWLVGVGVMAAYAIGSVLALRLRLGTSTPLEKGIRQNDSMDSPFVFGVFRPMIYLPYSLSPEDREFVVAHERAHIRRGDHLWKPLGFLLLSIHWFNPLLWVAYVLLCRDIEAACDEKVISQYTKEERQAYSVALFNCSYKRKTIAACPVAFGEVGVKNRIKGVMNYKKPSFWIIIVALLAGIAIAITFLTSPPAVTGAEPSSTPTASPTATPTATPNSTATPRPTATPTPVSYDVPQLDMSVYVEEDGYVHVSLKNVDNSKGDRVFANGAFEIKRLVNGVWVPIDPSYVYVDNWVFEYTDFTGFNVPIKLLLPERFVDGETYQVSLALTTDRNPSKGQKFTKSAEFVYEAYEKNYGWTEHYPKPLEEIKLYCSEDAIIDGGFVVWDGKVWSDGYNHYEMLLSWIRQGISCVMRFTTITTEPYKFTPRDFVFDGTKYTIRTLVDMENGTVESKDYKYLILFDGPKETPDAEYDYYERYVLTNSADVTWEQIYRGEYTDYFVLCETLTSYPSNLKLNQGISKITLEYKGELISQIDDPDTCKLIYDIFSKAVAHDMQSVCSCTWYTADTDLVMTLWYEDGATVVINPIRKYDVIVIGDNHYAYTDKYLLTYYVSSSHVNKTLLNCFGLEAWPE